MTKRQKTASTLFLCLLLAAFIELFTHCASPFSSCLYEFDQQCFYMAAKAWWNGLLPYRDCADVKGPFLYLFYMAGYLLSPTSLTGVFIIQIFWSALLYFVLYRTARLFLGVRQSVLAFGLALLSIYCPYFHDAGSRAEDVMILPLAILVYAVCRYALRGADENGGGQRDLLRLCALNGAAAWVFFFVKYNVCFTNVALAVWLIAEAYKRGLTAKGIAATCLGGLAVLTPFLTYFLVTGTLRNFIDVYISLNRETFSAIVPRLDVARIILDKYGVSLLCTCVWLAGILLLRAPARVKLPLLLLYIPLRVLTLMPFRYYSQIDSIFGIFAAVALIQRFPSLSRRAALAGMVGAIALVLLVSPRHNMRNAMSMLLGDPSHPGNPIERYLEQDPGKKLLILNSLDPGLGTKSHQLPAGPYWFTLNGLPGWCKQEQIELYKNGTADYILVAPILSEYDFEELRADLERYGYRLVMTAGTEQESKRNRILRVLGNMSYFLYKKTGK